MLRKPGVMARAFLIPVLIRDAEAGRSLSLWPPGLQEKPCHE